MIHLCMVLLLWGSTMPLRPVELIKVEGWLESAFVDWKPVEDAARYEVLYAGEGIDPTRIDGPLIRGYGDYFRADIPGLKAGRYRFHVKALDAAGAVVSEVRSPEIEVTAHIREGYAFYDRSGRFAPGGYTEDGTVKAGARIIYVSKSTVNTVSCTVVNERGASVPVTGLMNILEARGKGYDKSPLIIRMIGLIKAEDINGLKSDDYINFTGANSDNRMIENITFEGIGNDATVYGYGFHTKRAKGIEIRNLGIMLFGDDGISMESDNFNSWIHHNDFFYGSPGGDADQAKGDGSIDMKYNSTNITISYNHFWDSGKTTFFGGATEVNPIYCTYHHNWFDHSDSRGPRLCFATAHIYNNYFDANPTMCLLNTENTSAFVEANHYRNCPYPMMINMQGTNFEKWPNGEQNGGMTKAYNNLIENPVKLMYQTTRANDFDAWLATSRDERIPGTVTSRKGGNSYSNFDTGDGMYEYTADAPERVKEKVTRWAGRVEGGDLKWTFTIADESGKEIIPGLKAAIVNYASKLVSIQDMAIPENGEEEENPAVTGTGGNLCELMATGSASGFTITPAGTNQTTVSRLLINGASYSCALKIGSSQLIEFSTTQPQKLTLYFDPTSSNGKTLSIDGIVSAAISNGKLEIDLLPAGSHLLRRGNSETRLVYIALTDLPTSTPETRTDKDFYYADGKLYNAGGNVFAVHDCTGRLLLRGSSTTTDLSGFQDGCYVVRNLQTQASFKIIR